MKPRRKYLAMKLRKLRKVHGYTVEQVMKAIGLHSHARISQWENGEREPSTTNLVRLAVLYKVMVDYLLMEDRQQAVKEISTRLETFTADTDKPP